MEFNYICVYGCESSEIFIAIGLTNPASLEQIVNYCCFCGSVVVKCDISIHFVPTLCLFTSGVFIVCFVIINFWVLSSQFHFKWKMITNG